MRKSDIDTFNQKIFDFVKKYVKINDFKIMKKELDKLWRESKEYDIDRPDDCAIIPLNCSIKSVNVECYGEDILIQNIKFAMYDELMIVNDMLLWLCN